MIWNYGYAVPSTVEPAEVAAAIRINRARREHEREKHERFLLWLASL